MKKNNDQFELS